MKTVFEIKDLDQAKKQASETFRISEDKININILKEKKFMFGLSKTYKVEAVCNIDPVEEGFKVLTELFENMGFKATIEVRRRNKNEVYYSVNSNENPVLIGRNGKTLESIQFIIRSIVNSHSSDRLIVSVDIGGYKENRKRQIEILATKTAKEVARSKVPAKLQPMNAYERRIVHTKLSDWRDVSTESEGEAPNRYLVIKPKR